MESPGKHRTIALAMIGAGWVTGGLVYFTAAPDEADPLAQFRQSKKYLADIERTGGKAAVMTTQLFDWIGSCFRGASLGLTIGVLTSLVALAYWFVSTRPPARV